MSSESEEDDFLSANEDEGEEDNNAKGPLKCRGQDKGNELCSALKGCSIEEIDSKNPANSSEANVSEATLEQINKNELSRNISNLDPLVVTQSTIVIVVNKDNGSSLPHETDVIEKDLATTSTSKIEGGGNSRLKRPRKKLGEKISSTKPLVGISYDSTSNINKTTISEIEGEDSIEKKLHPDIQVIASHQKQESSWGSWGDWGTALVSTASSLSREVTKSVNAVLENASDAGTSFSTGAVEIEPEPEPRGGHIEHERGANDSVRTNEEKNQSADTSYDFGFGGALGSLVSGVSGAFETASNTILLGGLDTLEKIGRKTMDIIHEGDPGLRTKKAFLKFHKPNLSSVLKEARERALAEEEHTNAGEDGLGRPTKASLAVAWEDSEGPVHLEALGLIAKQCRGKIHSLLQELSPVWREKVQAKIDRISLCSCLEDCDRDQTNINSALMKITQDVQLPLPFNKLLASWPSLRDFLNKLSIEIQGGIGDVDVTSIQNDLFRETALFVSMVAAVCHKAAEMALITPDVDGLKLAEQFQRLCGCISGGLEKAADDVCESVTQTFPSTDGEFADAVTNIYVQIAHLNSYLERSLFDLVSILIYVEAKLAVDIL